MNSVKDVKDLIVRQTFKYLADFSGHIPDDKILSFLNPYINSIQYEEGREFVRNIILNSKHFFTRCSKEVRQKMAVNLFCNLGVLSTAGRNEFLKREGFYPPLLMVISPTMRCNFKCYGCYSANYSKENDLPFDIIDRVINEGKRYGIYFIVISGGEPFLRDDILDIFAKHSDVYFQVYNNGSMILKKDLPSKLSKLGNVLPCISVEGLKKETDKRRGEGTFEKILESMTALRDAGCLYGFSATATRENNELISNDEFVDFWVEQGCFIGWYFSYMPIGRFPSTELMPTPKQRIYRRNRIIEMRRKKPIVLADFWNDGPSVGGCISARAYLHINSNGDVEPCVFSQFAVDNIKNKSLVEVLKSDFFKKIREKQKNITNHLRPCLIIDNPGALREVVCSCNARATQKGGEELIDDMSAELDKYAKEYGNIANEIWRRNYLKKDSYSPSGEENQIASTN